MVALLIAAMLALPGGTVAKEPRRAPRSTRAAAPQPAPAPPPQAPAKSEEPLRIAAVGLSALNVPTRVADFYTEHLAQQMVGWGVRVTTPKEISVLIGFERQKQLLGCDEENTSCLAELGNALGVDGLLLGDVARFGDAFQVNVKVMAPADAHLLASYGERVESEDRVLDAFNRAARALSQELARKLGRTLPLPSPAFLQSLETQRQHPAAPSVRERPLLRHAWIPAAGGAVVALVGGGLLLSANASHQELTTTERVLSADRALELRQSGELTQRLGWVGVGLGAASLVAGAGMALYAREPQEPAPPLTAWLVPTPSGIQVQGVLP